MQTLKNCDYDDSCWFVGLDESDDHKTQLRILAIHYSDEDDINHDDFCCKIFNKNQTKQLIEAITKVLDMNEIDCRDYPNGSTINVNRIELENGYPDNGYVIVNQFLCKTSEVLICDPWCGDIDDIWGYLFIKKELIEFRDILNQVVDQLDD